MKRKRDTDFTLNIRTSLTSNEIKDSISEIVFIKGKKPVYNILFNVKNKDKIEMKLKEMNIEIIEKTIIDQVAPLEHLEYKDQIQIKEKELKEILVQMNFDKLEGIIESPVIDGYRNNCEYTCGLNKKGEITVGFLEGLFKDGLHTVGRPTDCKNIGEIDKEICLKFEDIIKESKLNVYDKQTHSGFWRALRIRKNLKNEILLVIQISDDMKEDLKEMIKKEFKDYNIILLYWKGVSNSPDPNSKQEIINGNSFIIETLLGYEFKISPNSFFQINTKTTELLYQTISEWCSKETVLLDLCSGTGTIGIVLSKYFKKVIGIEICESAVQDAIENAKGNKIENIEFICGKIEDHLDKVIKNEKDSKISAIVDPPRSGLHPNVCKTLLKSSLKEFIYVSCNPKMLVQNYNILKKGFRIKKAIGVDLFPHTMHCELVVLFERINQ